MCAPVAEQGEMPGSGWERIIGELACERGDYFHLLDAEGTISYSSSGVFQTTGYHPLELRGVSGFVYIHPDDVDRIKENFCQLLEAGSGGGQAEYRVRTASGKYRWLEGRVKNCLGDPELNAVLLFCRDITQCKSNEDILIRKNRELESANAALELALRVKDQFLTNMSHELRTPLTVIIGQSEILRDEIHGGLNEAQQKAVKSVESSGRHLLSLINDILDLSKIEASMLELYPETVDVGQLCASCLNYVKQELHRKLLTVSMTLDPVASSLRADPRRIQQILVNLLVNAVKFTPQGGEVGLEVIGYREKGLICFTVRDTGVGIAATDIERLFTPFVQVGSTSTRPNEGSGLGLALVRQLARLHGGTVTVTSEVGCGSRFTVTLPWEGSSEPGCDAVVPTLPAPPPERGGSASLHQAPLILVVDDSPATIEMMQGYLNHSNFRVIIASGGAEAVASVRDNSPDLVLMDIQMPGMDGLEAISRIRKLPGSVGKLPIIALTALAMRGDQERCLAAGADDYLSKPVSMKKLNIQIRDLLAKMAERNKHD